MSWFETKTDSCIRGDGQGAGRRYTLRLLAALFVVPALVTCGFHLRGQATYTFSSIYVNVTGAPVFESELKRALEGAGSAKLVPTASAAQVIVDIPTIADEKDVLSLSPAGSVQEYGLVMRVH